MRSIAPVVQAGQADLVTVLGDFSLGQHALTVNFLNDAYDGTPATDRNLYVDRITVDAHQGGSVTLKLRLGTSDVDAQSLGKLAVNNGQSIWIRLLKPVLALCVFTAVIIVLWLVLPRMFRVVRRAFEVLRGKWRTVMQRKPMVQQLCP